MPAIGFESRLANYELRGLVEVDGRYSFSIYDRQNGASFWLSADASKYGIRILDYDAHSRSIEVDIAGTVGYLSLAESEELVIIVLTDAGRAEDVYSDAVKIAADFLRENPDADLMDAPIPSSVRTSLLGSRQISGQLKGQLKYNDLATVEAYTGESNETNANAVPANAMIFYYPHFERSVRLEMRRLIREIIVGQ